ncbi:MAG: hypothetical protein M5U34_41915 [Chloroflexi bacterium]|nr:hypothetical protein [Chloroflexota bacterium]
MGQAIATGSVDPVCFQGLAPDAYQVRQILPNRLEPTTIDYADLNVEVGQTYGVLFGSRIRMETEAEATATVTAMPTAEVDGGSPDSGGANTMGYFWHRAAGSRGPYARRHSVLAFAPHQWLGKQRNAARRQRRSATLPPGALRPCHSRGKPPSIRERRGFPLLFFLCLAGALAAALLVALPLLVGPGLLNTRGGGDSPFLLQRLHQLGDGAA